MAHYSLYNHQFVEEKIYNNWIKKGYFYSVPNEKPSYTIVIPPPNVTGVLHIGHLLNNSIQDVLVRRARMIGYTVCWMPGTDHASIATEAKVVSLLYKENKPIYNLGKDYFLMRSWQWAYNQEDIILNQLQKLGCSCDWKRTSFTLDQAHSRSVTHCFVEMYRLGFIYRDYRMVNWDTNAKTTISNEEVFYQEKKGSLYYIQYPIVGIDEGIIVITTTRPETILGDTGICINPTDNRYTLLIGKEAIVPFLDRIVPIIEDKYVDKSFGAGGIKITPAHDINDAILASIHSLEYIDIIDENGSINENGRHYIRKDRFEVRKEIVEELHKKCLLVKRETFFHKIAISERTGSIIESRRSIQWYLNIKDIANPALDAVRIGDIRFYPKAIKNIYINWMKNIQDWNISRQLSWGHKLPVFFYGTNIKEYVVASSFEEAIELVKNKKVSVENLKHDENVLDTWFSSWIWPLSVFGGLCRPTKTNIQYYYPTKDLITGPDILFFWVARMIMAGYAFLNRKPFDNVFFTGIVRDIKGRKMAKSKGNSPDPIQLIKKYGSDSVRMGILLKAKAGKDLFFNEELCLYGRNFSNKLWNAFRFIHLLIIDKYIETPYYSHLAIEWYEHLLLRKINYIEYNLIKYSISGALNNIYKLIWHDFCSWFLELIKPITSTGQLVSQFVLAKLLLFFEESLKLLHPFIPYISEKIWHIIRKRSNTESIIISHWPFLRDICNKQIIEDFKFAEKLVNSIRNVRKNNALSLKKPIIIYSLESKKKRFFSVALKLANISLIYFLNEKPIFSQLRLLIETQKYFIFFSEDEKKSSFEIINIQTYIEYYYVFLSIVRNKLEKKTYIISAPLKVVNIERKKYTDILNKIKLLIDNNSSRNENDVFHH